MDMETVVHSKAHSQESVVTVMGIISVSLWMTIFGVEQELKTNVSSPRRQRARLGQNVTGVTGRWGTGDRAPIQQVFS